MMRWPSSRLRRPASRMVVVTRVFSMVASELCQSSGEDCPALIEAAASRKAATLAYP